MSNTTSRTEAINHAREIDTQVAALWAEVHVITDQIKELQKSIRSANKMVAYYGGVATNRSVIYNQEVIAKAEAKIAAFQPELAEKREAAQAFDKENYKGWSRFFLVEHIHSSAHCSSFRPTTRVGWLPDVSGLTEAEAVAAHGEALCTICFPSAPTALTVKQADPATCTGSGKYTREQRRYVTCPDCGGSFARTTYGNIRKHKAA